MLTICVVQHFGGDPLIVVRVERGTLALVFRAHCAIPSPVLTLQPLLHLLIILVSEPVQTRLSNATRTDTSRRSYLYGIMSFTASPVKSALCTQSAVTQYSSICSLTSEVLLNRLFFIRDAFNFAVSFDCVERSFFLLPAELAFSSSEAELFPDEVSSSSDAVEVFFFCGLVPAREAGSPK